MLGRRKGQRRLSDPGHGGQESLEAFGSRERGLQDVVVLGQVGDRPEEPLDILQERE